MGNPYWNCPLIALIMRFFLACTDFCIKWCKFDVNRCFFSFLSNEVRPVYFVKRYIFTSRRLTSPCVFRLMSVFASAHRRKEGIFTAVTNNIREIREQRGIYQDDLAAAIGFSTKTVGRIERGDSTPSAEFMLRISKYFNLLVEDVFHEITANVVVMSIKRLLHIR